MYIAVIKEKCCIDYSCVRKEYWVSECEEGECKKIYVRIALM